MDPLTRTMVAGSPTTSAYVARYGTWMPWGAGLAVAVDHCTTVEALMEWGAVCDGERWHTASVFEALGY